MPLNGHFYPINTLGEPQLVVVATAYVFCNCRDFTTANNGEFKKNALMLLASLKNDENQCITQK